MAVGAPEKVEGEPIWDVAGGIVNTNDGEFRLGEKYVFCVVHLYIQCDVLNIN